MRSLKLFLFVLFVPGFLFCQNKEIRIAGRYQTGLILPHYKSMNYIIKDKVYAFDLIYSIPSNGSKEWHQAHKNPVVGFAYSYTNLGNKKVFGSANTMYAFLNKKIIDSKRYKLNYDLSVGVAYMNKPFDKKDNVNNFVISSPVNAYLHIYFDQQFKISNRLFLISNFGITHFSNGASKQPNKGLNILNAGIGISYSTNPEREKDQIEFKEFNKKNKLTIILSGGKKENFPTWNKKYLVSSLSISATRLINIKTGLGFGADIFFDPSLETKYKKQGIPKKYEFIFSGVHFCYDLIFGKMSFTIQQGIHTTFPAADYPFLYQRYGLRYNFRKNIIANLTLKAYLGFAQFIEFGIGYKIERHLR